MEKRIYAGIIDFLIITFIQFILIVSFAVLPMISQKLENNFDIIFRSIIITFISLIYLIIRDIIGNKSIGKRIFKLKIIDKKSKNKSSFLQRIIRNITWLLGPIEVLYFISKSCNYRIGDLIANTEVVSI